MGNFGERLKTARLAAGLSQERLGIEAGIEPDSASARMNRYEKGTRVPAVEIVAQIARILNLPVSYFYSQDDDEAQLLVAFHRMSVDRRKRLINAVVEEQSK